MYQCYEIANELSLQTLWEEERRTLNQEQKQSFVDLGCGNGLLVYILSEEGVIKNYYNYYYYYYYYYCYYYNYNYYEKYFRGLSNILLDSLFS